MAHQDPIADMLTRLRNGVQALNRFVDFSLSKEKFNILKVFEEHGFIDSILLDEDKRRIRVFLKYFNRREPVIQGLRRCSKPSRRLYIGKDKIPIIFGGLGVVVISTSMGVLDGKTARMKGVGGELICSIW